MKRVRRVDKVFPPVYLDETVLGAREPSTLRGVLVGLDGEEHLAACVRCPDTPCRSTGPDSADDVCPVAALEISQADGSVLVSADCVGCGICVIRCPVGALHYCAVERCCGGSTSELMSAVPTTRDEFEAWLTRAGGTCAVGPDERRSFLNTAMRRAEGLFAREFYPLVASLFRVIGVPATPSNPGDTSNRIDLVLTDPIDPIPVEVKSRTEVEAINIKSVQQALENKLVISRLAGMPSLSDTSTLIVGYRYPPDRSGVDELIDDIEDAFGIRIGLISLRRLYEVFLEVTLDGVPFDRARLESLKGPL